MKKTLLAVALAASFGAQAGVVTLDFNGNNQGFTMTNSCSDGYTDAEYAARWPAVPGADGTYHVSKFCPHDSTLDPEVVLTRDDGGAFSLLGFDSDNLGVRVRSSSGGEAGSGSTDRAVENRDRQELLRALRDRDSLPR